MLKLALSTKAAVALLSWVRFHSIFTDSLCSLSYVFPFPGIAQFFWDGSWKRYPSEWTIKILKTTTLVTATLWQGCKQEITYSHPAPGAIQKTGELLLQLLLSLLAFKGSEEKHVPVPYVTQISSSSTLRMYDRLEVPSGPPSSPATPRRSSLLPALS